jgi:hypothetical protein
MTNIGKSMHIKPNLLDPIIGKKIIRTLMPPRDDYWAPVKSSLRTFYQKYIKTNILLVIIIVLIIFFLVYRYHVVKKRKEILELNGIYEYSNNIPEDSKMVLRWYNLQKEHLREPKFNNLMQYKNDGATMMAYPIYPYAEGGTLVPSGSR